MPNLAAQALMVSHTSTLIENTLKDNSSAQGPGKMCAMPSQHTFYTLEMQTSISIPAMPHLPQILSHATKQFDIHQCQSTALYFQDATYKRGHNTEQVNLTHGAPTILS